MDQLIRFASVQHWRSKSTQFIRCKRRGLIILSPPRRGSITITIPQRGRWTDTRSPFSLALLFFSISRRVEHNPTYFDWEKGCQPLQQTSTYIHIYVRGKKGGKNCCCTLFKRDCRNKEELFNRSSSLSIVIILVLPASFSSIRKMAEFLERLYANGGGKKGRERG